MPKSNTDIQAKGIASVVADASLEVPLHQRPFEWKANDEVQEMLEDVGSAFGRNREDYFLGSLVVVGATGGERAKVLDGQQRLAVVSLLLASIADEFEKRGEAKRAQAIRNRYLVTFDIVENAERPQLKLNQADDAYFRSILEAEANQPGSGAPESHHRLWEARQLVAEWLEHRLEKAEKPSDLLADFTRYLDDSAYVIYFVVPDDANAFLIFETMNDRGLDLSIADLLKNYLLGRAGEDLTTVLSHWTTALGSLSAYGGEYLFTVFLRHFWSSKYGLVREKELYRSIRTRVVTAANALDFADELARNSYYYAAILSPEHEFWSEASVKAREDVRTLSLLGLEQYRPLLLSAIAHLPIEELERLLPALISWNVRLLIVGGLGGGVIENFYCTLAQKIRNGELKSVKEVAMEAKSVVPNDATFRGEFANARVSKAVLARYYLRTLELVASGTTQFEKIPSPDPNELTLEHVLPERPAANVWTQLSDDERKAYTKRLGNLILLTQKMNSKLRSSSFDVKREIYAKSELTLTRQAADYSQWGTQAINGRQQYLAELAVKAWRLDM